MNGNQDVATVAQGRLETTASRLRELVAHLRHQRAHLREEWARLITEAKLLTATTREELFAKVVVLDITGVPYIDSPVANHLVQTVEAARLLGAIVIVTGLSPEIAQTLVNIGVDLGKMNTVGDLQGGIEEAERLLGYKVVPMQEPVLHSA